MHPRFIQDYLLSDLDAASYSKPLDVDTSLKPPASQDPEGSTVRLSFKASHISTYDIGNDSEEEGSNWKKSYLISKRSSSHIVDPQKNIKANPSYKKSKQKFLMQHQSKRNQDLAIEAVEVSKSQHISP